MADGTFSVVIAGGGLAGLSAAIALCKLVVHSSSITGSNGLVLAITIFEKDPTPDARIQGYRLGVSPRGASALNTMGILEKVAHADAVPQAIHEGQNFVFTTSDGSYLAGAATKKKCRRQSRENNATDKRVSEAQLLHERLVLGNWFVNRGVLRSILLETLLEVANTSRGRVKVVWATQVVGFDLNKTTEKEKQSPVTVTLDDGTHLQADMLLGCDGIFSKVRKALPDAVHRALSESDTCEQGQVRNPPLRHLGVAWVRGWVEDHGQLGCLFPHTVKVGDAWSAAMGDTQGSTLVAECSPAQWGIVESSKKKPVITWFFAFRYNLQKDSCPARNDSPERVAQEVLQRIGSASVESSTRTTPWHPAAIKLVKNTLTEKPASLMFRHLYDRDQDSYSEGAMPPAGPPLESWAWVPVTLLGDAFHPVASYALTGGGSDAMGDGVDVAEAIVKGLEQHTANGNDIAKNVAISLREYEEAVRIRSISASRRSGMVTSFIHSGWLSGRVARTIFALLRHRRTLMVCGSGIALAFVLNFIVTSYHRRRSSSSVSPLD